MPQDSTAPATNSNHPIRVLTFNVLLTRSGGLRPRGPPSPSLAGPHDPRSAPAGAPVARLTQPGGVRPRGPPSAVVRGGPSQPRTSARPRRSLGEGGSPSLAARLAGRLLLQAKQKED